MDSKTLFWTMWGLPQVRNFRVRVWGPWLPPMAATTFYTDDATISSRVASAIQITLASHCSYFCGLILPCTAQVESLRHAVSIVILLLLKLWPFSVHRWERSLLDGTYKALCHRNVLLLFRELSGLLILLVSPCWALAGQLLYHPSFPSPRPFPEEGHRWACFECRCAWKRCQGKQFSKLSRKIKSYTDIPCCTKMGEETLSIWENWNIRLHFQIKMCYMYMYLLYVFWKHSSTSCSLLK